MTVVATNPNELIGEIIGGDRYDVRELLGGGSMGHVYRAFDRRLETDIVIKIPRRSRLENPDTQRRFKQESKFLVKFSHPYVVTILDIGEFDGLPFFVMPFIKGGSLRSRQRNEYGVQKPMPASSLRGWLMEISKALDFVHSQGCVHRDVKPDNILFDEYGHAFLSDFGLSKLVQGGESNDVNATAAGAVVGTPMYVAPELVVGKPFDGRADQYSLALMIYESLAGTNPMEGKSGSATMVNQTQLRLPPLKELASGISVELSAAVMRGVSKLAAKRFGSCVEFAEAVLNAIQDNNSSSSSPMSNGRKSSAANGPNDTTTGSKRGVGSSARPASGKTMSMMRTLSSDAPVQMKRVVGARKPIIKGKSECPSCSRSFTLQPGFAGKKATCQGCGCKVLIAPDFREIRQLELVEIRSEPNATSSNRSSATSGTAGGEFDLVLGAAVFGWKLNYKIVYGIAGTLVLFLMLMTMYFTNLTAEAEQERIRDQLRPRQMESLES